VSEEKPAALLDVEGLVRLPHRLTGVYFLVKDGRVVYVGQSVNVLERVLKHRTKDFDEVWFLACRECELNEKERSFLDALVPRLNRDQRTMDLRENQRAAAILRGWDRPPSEKEME